MAATAFRTKNPMLTVEKLIEKVAIPMQTFRCLLLIFSLLPLTATYAASTLNPGDMVRVKVFGQEDLATTARISDDGTISMPLINQVRLSNETLSGAQAIIERALANQNYVRNPQVSVYLVEQGSSDEEAVTILGHINKPGRFPVSSAEGGARTLVSLLALAGGVAKDAGDRLMLTRRENDAEKTLFVNLENLVQRGNLAENHGLLGGDVVFVPKMKEIYVYGEVRKPGRYKLERNMSVIQALSVGGGLSAKGTEKGLTIRRTNDKGKLKTIKVGLDHLLQQNDVLYVREALF